MKFSTLMLVAGASATTTKVVLNCHTNQAQYDARSVLSVMESSTIAEDVSSQKTNKASIAKRAAKLASSKKALDTCYSRVGATTPADKSKANINKCSRQSLAFADATAVFNADSCMNKVYDMKASQFNTIPAIFGMPAVAKIALPKAVVCKWSKETLKANALKYKKSSVQKIDAANYEKQAAALGLAYKFGVAELEKCYAAVGAKTPADQKKSNTLKCKDYYVAKAKIAAEYGKKECDHQAALKKYGGDTVLIIIIVVAVLLLCCIGGFFAHRSRKSGGDTVEEGTAVNEFNNDLYTAFIDEETA